MTQTALATTLGLSTSYVNQLENDHRPLTVPVLLRLNSMFDLDMAFFAADTDARLLADLQEVLAENPDTTDVTAAEIDELLSRTPFAARALVSMHRRLRGATEQLEQLAPDDPGASPTSPRRHPTRRSAISSTTAATTSPNSTMPQRNCSPVGD